MANGWNVVGAVLGVGAIGAAGLTAGVMVVDRHSSATLFALQTGDEAAKLAASVVAGAGRAMATEVAAAAAVPQLRAALGNRVDAATLEDLFTTEDWWGPFRERSVAIVNAGRTLVSHPMHQVMPDTDIAARARSEGGAVSELKQTAGVPALVGAVAMKELPGAPVLVLTRPIDAALVGEWARSAGTSLAVTDGQRLVAGSDIGIERIPIAGRERDATFPNDGRFVVAPSALGGGLWLWSERTLPPPPDGRLWMWGLVGLAAVAAATLGLLGRGRRPGAALAITAAAPAPAPIARDDAGDSGHRNVPDGVALRPPGGQAAAMTASGTLRKFGRYELVERIGEGGMSDIYSATMRGAKGFERILVVKRLKRELSRNHAAVEQFIDEARLGSLLSHPNIVQVHDFGEADDGYFMALEYVPGRNLSQIVERHLERFGRALDAPTVFYLVHDVLQALAYAHDRTNPNGEPLGIVHRDVSPANIMVSTRGDVKLLDFGIVKAEDRLSRSDVANIKGNPAFMAPEQARGTRVDGRADLFSLGLVMVHALTGELVYRNRTAGETLFHAATGPTREEMEYILATTEPAGRIIERALATEVEDRFQTAEEFAAAVAPHIRPGARVSVGALMLALFGPELRSEGQVSGAVDRNTPIRPRAS